MKPEEFARIYTRLPRDRSFVVHEGVHIHTCKVRFPSEHPAFTDAAHCGKCWVESQETVT